MATIISYGAMIVMAHAPLEINMRIVLVAAAKIRGFHIAPLYYTILKQSLC